MTFTRGFNGEKGNKVVALQYLYQLLLKTHSYTSYLDGKTQPQNLRKTGKSMQDLREIVRKDHPAAF